LKETQSNSLGRIESLSDLIFGLALSIGSLILIAKIPSTTSELIYDIVQFALSFLFLVIIWTVYTGIANVMPVESDLALGLNLSLLFFVAIEPFLYFVLVNQTSYAGFASSIYGLDIGLMYFVLAGMITVALSSLKQKNMSSKIISLQRRRVVQIVVGTLFIVSALPIFWVKSPVGGSLRIDLWIAGFFSFLVFRLWQKISQKR
jgi:uncharacterized membrane protein